MSKKHIMLSAMSSNSGKTVLTCALLSALCQRGLAPEAFKCGPDYIDPMFHTQVLGVPSRNVDEYLQGMEGALATLNSQKSSIAVVEGAMGFYDGVGSTDSGSAWELALLGRIPVILVVEPQGSSLTLAAQLQGMMHFRFPCPIVGVIFNRCKPSRYEWLKETVEEETDLEVLGYLPPMEEAELASRHLGLVTAPEVEHLQERFRTVAAQLEKTVNVDQILALAGETGPDRQVRVHGQDRCVIGVARDEAFCFRYEESLKCLEDRGAKLAFFSPLHDAVPPEMDGLYLCGGYPELHAKELSENTAMRTALKELVEGGLPTVAECGGFLYLQQELQDSEGQTWPMAGVLPGRGYPTGQLQRFGYARLYAPEDSLLFEKRDRLPVHEFHHWDSTEPGSDLWAEKEDGTDRHCCTCTPTLYAGFPHFHFEGSGKAAQRFVRAAAEYRQRKKA